MTTEQRLAMTLEELARRAGSKPKTSGLFALLFPKQKAFIESPAKRKAALCSRRAGKSFGTAVLMLDTCERFSNSIVVYLALTRLSAKRIMWPVLKDLNERHQLGLEFNNSELIARFKNGSQILLTGADDQGQIDKLRGSAYRLAVIDEAASFGSHINELVDEVLEPALLDHNGTMVMIGTPSPACVGKFFDVTTTATDWDVHRWTVLDNPYIPHAREWLDKRRVEMGWDQENPIYQREWLGRWIKSLDAMVYRHTSDNIIDALPAGRWQNILGIDLGVDDDSAFQIATFSTAYPHCYLRAGWKKPGMSVSDVANKAQEYIEKFQPVKIVCDTGGLGKMVALEMQQRFNIPVTPAEKQDKLGAIELINSDLRSGFVKVLQKEPVLREWEVLQWDEKRLKEDPRFPNHLADAALYAYRESLHWSHRPAEVLPDYGSPEWYEREENLMDDDSEDKNPWWDKQT